MAKIAIVKKNSLKIESMYEADAPKQRTYAGPWGDATQCSHMLVPTTLEDLEQHMLEAISQTEKWTKNGEADILDASNLPLDWEIEGYVYQPPIAIQKNVQDTRDSQLRTLRVEIGSLMDEADVERKKHEDNDPNKIAAAADWSTYRIALRATTDNYKDVSDSDVGTNALDAFSEDVSDFVYPTKPS